MVTVTNNLELLIAVLENKFASGRYVSPCQQSEVGNAIRKMKVHMCC
jgi:hypothetical protein